MTIDLTTFSDSDLRQIIFEANQILEKRSPFFEYEYISPEKVNWAQRYLDDGHLGCFISPFVQEKEENGTYSVIYHFTPGFYRIRQHKKHKNGYNYPFYYRIEITAEFTLREVQKGAKCKKITVTN